MYIKILPNLLRRHVCVVHYVIKYLTLWQVVFLRIIIKKTLDLETSNVLPGNQTFFAEGETAQINN